MKTTAAPRLLMLLLIASAPVAASAQLFGDSKVDCPYLVGVKLTPEACEKMRLSQEREAARLAKQKADREKAEADYEAAEGRRQREIREREAQAQVEADRVAQRQKEEDAARAKESAEADRQQAIADRNYAAMMRDRKAECGKDFGRPRVGMSFERAQHCVGGFALFGQIAAPGGTVSQYRSGPTYINVQGGVIVHWTRL